MFKLLVVENEYADYRHLTEMVDLGALGVDQADCRTSGEAALERILEDTPDLVLCNVELTGMDGLELLHRCREQGISSTFVMVSRNQSFTSVRNAMRLGAADYLLKPIEAEDFIRVLSQAVESRRAMDTGELSERLFVTRRLLRNSFMASFTAPEPWRGVSLDELNRTYHFNLQEGIFRTAIVAVHELPEPERGVFLPALAQSLRAKFDPLCYEMIPYVWADKRLTLTFNYAPGSPVESRFPELLEILREQLHRRGCDSLHYAIGLGAAESKAELLHRTLETAERALRCRLLRGGEQMFDYARLRFDAVKGEDILTPTLLGELRAGAELLDENAYRKAVESAFASISTLTDPAVILDVLHAAVDAVYSVCTEAGYDAVTPEGRTAVFLDLRDALTLSATREMLCRWAGERFAACREERQNSRPVRAARQYIQVHYAEPLTLELIAEQVHLNASYFSIIFKKQTGQNFSDFLTACRIEAAKQLLRDTDMPVSAVCEAVGYLDRKYFSRTFMKLVGIKPSAYRALHG